MNNKKKNRPNSARSPRPRGSDRSSIATDGLYSNAFFVHTFTCQVGNTVKIQTKNGAVFEGILKTFSLQFEVVLEYVHRVDTNNLSAIDVNTLVDKMIFKLQDILYIEATDTDGDYITRDSFQTDTVISKYNGQVTEKELEPWDCPVPNNSEEYDLDGNAANGWDVNDMFKKNEQMYGVISTYDHALSGYTTQLQVKDTKDYKEAEAEATKIANEIENNPNYKARIDVENGDEEDKYAAVTRPMSQCDNSEPGNKYVCPPKRKTIQNNSKAVRTSANTSSAQQPQVSQTLQQQPQSPQQNSTQTHSSASTTTATASTNTVVSTAPSTTSVASTNNNSKPAQSFPLHHASTPHHSSVPSHHVSTPPHHVATPPHHSTSQHHPVASAHSTGRDRVNGVLESPKPQRTVTNSRHVRNFLNNDSGRFPGNSPVSTSTCSSTSNQSVESKSITSTHHQTTPTQSSVTFTSSTVPSSSDPPHVKKPSPQYSSEHPSVTNPSSVIGSSNSNSVSNSQRKLSRGRDDQLNDLKKFGSDFQLSEPLVDDAKKSQQTTIEETPSGKATETVSSSEPNVNNRPTTGSPDVDKKTKTTIKSKLNPNAKEFVYNPNAKPFTPRSASTPSQSRPHTPQTPGYGGPPVLPIPTMMPTYVVTTAPPLYSQPHNQNRYRKVPMNAQPSQMQVAAATGQPLLAPAPMHTQFTVPYSPQPHIGPQPYQPMVRMVPQQSGGHLPPVIATINYPPDGATQAQIPFMGPGGMTPHPHHPHHPPHVHPPPNTAPSPQTSNGHQGQMGNSSSSSGQGGGSSGGGSNAGGGPQPPYPPSIAPAPSGSYAQPPPPPPGASAPQPPTHTFPMMCPILPGAPPPPHPSHGHMMAAAAHSSVQPFIHHHHQHQHSSSVGSSLVSRSREGEWFNWR